MIKSKENKPKRNIEIDLTSPQGNALLSFRFSLVDGLKNYNLVILIEKKC